MLSEEVGEAMGSAYSWESMGECLERWRRTFQYRWVNGRIWHPLPYQESHRRSLILYEGYRFLARMHQQR